MPSLISLFVFLFSLNVFAMSVDTPLADAELESRAKSLFYEIRCVVCAGEAIADSPAEVARDMRRVVRERVADGQSDEQIKADLAKQYGDVILMKPPLKKSTLFLWFAPWITLVFGGYLVFSLFKKAKKQ